jgi:hypothetical protein
VRDGLAAVIVANRQAAAAPAPAEPRGCPAASPGADASRKIKPLQGDARRARTAATGVLLPQVRTPGGRCGAKAPAVMFYAG